MKPIGLQCWGVQNLDCTWTGSSPLELYPFQDNKMELQGRVVKLGSVFFTVKRSFLSFDEKWSFCYLAVKLSYGQQTSNLVTWKETFHVTIIERIILSDLKAMRGQLMEQIPSTFPLFLRKEKEGMLACTHARTLS